MKWLKRKIRRKILDILDEEPPCEEKSVALGAEKRQGIDKMPDLRFKIYSAQNGTIVEFTHPRAGNANMDEEDRRVLYLVPKDKDIAEYISKCMSMEGIR